MPENAQGVTIKKVFLRLMPVLFISYILAYIDRINIGFAAIRMNVDLGISPYIFGLGAGVFFIGYFIFEIPSNLMLEKTGARRWIARIMISWGVLSACMAFVQGPTSFIIARFFLGVAEAGFFPGVILYLTYWFPQEYRARIIAAFMVAIPVSLALGAPLSTAILQMDGLGGLKGWQWLFIIEGVPTVLFGLVFLTVMPDRPVRRHGSAVRNAAGCKAQSTVNTKPSLQYTAPTCCKPLPTHVSLLSHLSISRTPRQIWVLRFSCRKCSKPLACLTCKRV